jgi:porin
VCIDLSRGFRLIGLALIALLAAPAGVGAEKPPELSEDNTEADDVAANLERRRRLEGAFGTDDQAPGWLQRWRDKRSELFEKVGLDFVASYDLVGLAAFGGGGPDTGFGGDLTVNGTWHLGGDRWNLPLDLRFRVRDRHAFGDLPPSAVGVQTGALWGLVDGFSDAGLEIPDFQLVQKIPKQDIELRYGQMVIESQFDRHALRSSKQAFMNRAFSSNPAVAFPRFGAGVTLHKKVDRGFDFTVGASSVQGTTSGTQVDFDLGSGDFFQAIQGGWDFEINGDPARFQAMLWRSDPVEDISLPGGEGVSLMFERALPECDARWFARAAWANGEATDVDYMLSAGAAVERNENDLFGFGLGAGRDSSGTADWQGVFECFYRLQRSAAVQITPAVQVVFGESLPGRDVRLVAGICGSLAF